LLDKLQKRVKTSWTDMPLQGLSDADVQDFLDRAGVPLKIRERDDILRESRGLPSYLEEMVRCQRAGRSWSDAKVDLELQYSELREQVCAAGPESLGERLLGLLCVSLEPLDMHQLVQLSRATPGEVRPLLNLLQPHLLLVDRKVGLFHDRFRQLLKKELARETLSWCHKEIVQWTQNQNEPSPCGIMV
jgi:hypothetical protein